MVILYEGNARVYLQGENALYPVTNISSNPQMHYYIGDESTKLVVRDFRSESVQRARKALELNFQNGFAKSFNQHAWIKVKFDDTTKQMEIDLLKDAKPFNDCPILWMGILEDNIMSAYEVQWEVFKSFDTSRTAFVALIEKTS